jgi:hypothetical protein
MYRSIAVYQFDTKLYNSANGNAQYTRLSETNKQYIYFYTIKLKIKWNKRPLCEEAK